MKSIKTSGISVLNTRTKQRIVFREEIFELPPELRSLRQVAVHTFTLPDGSEGRWESVYSEMTHRVFVAALTTGGKLILVKLFRLPAHSDCLELPGGDARGGKDLTTLALRELRNKTGYTSCHVLEKLGGGRIASGDMNARFTVFAAFDCHKTRRPELDQMEKFAGLRVVKKYPREIWGKIAQGDQNIDPQLAFAILALYARGLISL